jgi:thioredoxin 1
MSENVKEFTDGDFASEALKNPLPVIVDFWAEWCGPCKMLMPIITKLAAEFSGKVVVGKLDVDKNPQTAARYSINSIPSLLFIQNGQVQEQHTGLLAEKPLGDKIRRVFDL